GRSSGLLGGYFVRLRIPDGRPVPLVLSQLASAGAATAQSPNHLYSLQQGETALPRFALKALALPDTRQRARGKNIRVAVVDTGVDAGHEALAGAILGTFDALPDIPLNQTQHATAIAGLIAGRKEILGVAEGAGLLIARAFDSLGDEQASSRTDALVDAFDWAAGEDAQVVNMSFAGPRNPMLSRVLAKMAERGMILVAAAGNNGPDAAFAYPGAEAGVMAVTATDARNRIYDRANRGRYIFAAAPGVDILAPAAGGGIELVTGTSFAAALMTGIVALLLEAEPGIGSPEISGRLKNSAKDLGPPGPDPIFGAGLANAARALATKN
ncbi:MAG: S8 family serine peptidase, partial [Hyphomicrobiaceae bacterium]